MESIAKVAEYFLSKESMTHKKLQKLCYYAQAWYLANYGKQLVPNRFEAWVHGPVSPDLYQLYRDWGWERIPKLTDIPVFEDRYVKSFLDAVYDTYGDYSGDQLEMISHSEKPWKEARGNCRAWDYSRNPISLKNMKDYYGERINSNHD